MDAISLAGACERYHAEGYAGPFRSLPEAEALAAADALLREAGGPDTPFAARRNRHLDWPLVDRIARAEPIVAVARALLGDRLVLWRSQMFFMEAGKGLRWHRDEYLTLLADPARQVSIHLSLTRTREDNCIRIVPRSHVLDREELDASGFRLVPGSEGGKYGAPNFWRDPASALRAMPMLLEPGTFFVFHPRLLHGSRDVTTPDDTRPAAGHGERRVGIGLRIAAADNTVLPAAFAETLPRPDRAASL